MPRRGRAGAHAELSGDGVEAIDVIAIHQLLFLTTAMWSTPTIGSASRRSSSHDAVLDYTHVNRHPR